MSAEEEKQAYTKAIKVIGGHKAQITRAAVTLDKVVATGSAAPDDVSSVKSAKSMVEKQMIKIEGQVDDLLGNDNFTQATLDDLTDYLLDRGNLCEKISAILEDTSGVKKGDATILDTSGIGEALSESLMQLQFRQPIAASDLPTFNGECAEFEPFIETFNFMIHENEAIPDAMKASYLKRCIREKGPDGRPNSAYELIKHITPTNQNYKIMRDKLIDRFKISYLNRAVYIANLRQLSTWKPCHTGIEIRKLYDYITQNLDLLELAGGSSVNESDILLSDVLALIPKFIVHLFLEVPEEDRNLRRLLKDIDRSVSRMLEQDALVPKAKPAYNTNHRPVNNNRNNTNNRSSYTYQTAVKNECIFCGQDHSAFTCSNGSVHDRLSLARERRFCHNCLYGGHFSADCKYSSNCPCGKGKHCKALCYQPTQINSNPSSSIHGRGRGFGNQRGANGGYQSRGRRGATNTPGGRNINHNLLSVNPDISVSAIADTECFMEIGRGFVKSNLSDDFVPARFLFDSASNGSYGTKRFMHGVACEKVGERNIEIDTFCGGEVKCQNCDIVKLIVHDHNNFYEPTEICISVMDFLCRDVQSWQLTSHQSKCIRHYQLADPAQVSGELLPINILIGLDNYWKLMHKRTDDPGFGPKLRSSKLGWILSGQRDFSNPRLLTTKSNNPLTLCVQSTFVNVVTAPPDMSDKLGQESILFTDKSPLSEEEEYCSRFSDLETFGIRPDQEISPVLEGFNNDICFNKESKRYQVRLPFIGRLKDKLNTQYGLSKVRLDSLFEQKIRKPEHAGFAKDYYDIINEQEKLGVIERVTDMAGNAVRDACYIPHHGVLKDGKLRIVYDGSVKSSKEAVSLNDCLSPGPSLTNELVEMLMRFRIHDVVLSGDIQKAFLQIEVAEADRDYLRFLWYDLDGNLVVYRFARVPFGLRCSSFLLNATLQYHMQKHCLEGDNPDLLQLLSRSHYVDDWLVGAKTPEEVLLIKTWLTEFLERIGMKLHKFNSNSEAVRQSLSVDCPEHDSILGINWDASGDEVSLKIERALGKMSKESTKCELYSAPPRIFDPLGFLQPFIFNAKLLFQEVCKAKIKWKAKLPPEIAEKFEHWKRQIGKLAEIKLPRQVVIPNYDTVELHGFGDASKLGYCACVYLVSRNSALNVSRLVVSKTRVSPLKEMSIPRLELTAAFLLSRLMAIVIKFHNTLKFDKLVYYSDSTTTLHWIHSDYKQWKTYVANRVRDINLLSSPDDWKYVKTDDNPADLGTRGIDAADLVGNDFWFHGPKFLISGQTDITYDQTHDTANPISQSLLERRKIVTMVMEKVAVVERLLPLRKNGLSRKLTDYGRVDGFLVVLGYVYKFIQQKIGATRFSRWLGYVPCSADSFTMIAEQRLVRAVQQDHFANEIVFCRGNPKVRPSGMKVTSSKVQQLGLFLDDGGILRVNTRLGNADISSSAKEPMLLPKHSYFTTLIIWRVHHRLHHAGVDQTLAELRQMYWVPQGRQVIRNILRTCVRCRMILAAPYPVLAQPQLPGFRVETAGCFHNAGVDFAGPLVIGTLSTVKRRRKQQKQVKKQRKEDDPDRKVWLVIFTCAVSRNVHSEVLDGMTVSDFMHGLRRFVAKYGPPTLLYSDNAKTFECVARELPQVLSHPRLHKYLNSRKMTWKFYVQRAPWMGGFIERMVGLYKSSIKRVMGRARLDYQEFVTLISELNGMLNSRPISYVYDTVGEGDPITPSKLWCGKNITMFPPFYEARIDGHNPEICNKRLKYLDKVLTHFWNRFSTQYLSSLSERHFSRNLPKSGRQPKVGEVVLVKHDVLPRGCWKIAKVVKVTPGPDGVVRRVELRLPISEHRNTHETMYRPPRLLVPLECEVDNNNKLDVDQEDTNHK